MSQRNTRDPRARREPPRRTNVSQRRPAPPQRPPRRRPRRRPQARFYLLLLLVIAVIAALIALIALRQRPVKETPASETVTTESETNAPVMGGTEEALTSVSTTSPAQPSQRAAELAAMLGDEGNVLTALSSSEQAVVTDLSINESLPTEWLNVLLLGSDERIDGANARTDSMIICSINTQTGQVKLTSILRDLAVDFDDLGELSGTYRINAANYFGGEALAMKTVNECFGLNIEYYVRVNFFGFQQVAHLLGGIDVDITQAEMEQINQNIVEQYKFAVKSGIDDSNLPKEYLTTYGANTHLDGRQTLGYARIRKLDGGDFARAERQRTVLTALLEKLEDADMGKLLEVATAAMPYVKTNLNISTIVTVAGTVLNNGVNSVEAYRVPTNGTYVQETRNDQSMLYDCDWATNTAELYSFIYS